MKNLKRVLAVLLAAIMISLSMTTILVSAEEKDVTPVIVVGGYSSSDLFLDYGTENEEHVWSFNVESVLKKVEKKLDKLGLSLLDLASGKKNAVMKVITEVILDITDVLTCNDDGTSKYNVTAGLTDPAITNTKSLVENYGENNGYIQLPRINNYFCDEIGSENVFNCHVDFRMGAVKCAKALDAYVKAVKEYTGAKQVSLFGLSHGGMTIGVYLNLLTNYPSMVTTSLDDIKKAIMFHPALAGAEFATDFLDNSIKLDVAQITEYAEVGALSEYEFEILTQLIDAGVLNDVCTKIVDAVFHKIVGNWGSVWDFAKTEKYEEWKVKYLDETENAQLISESDFMHYSIMPKYDSAFKKAQDSGVDVQIIAGYGRSVVTGTKVDSDGILAVKSTTGAKVAPYGKRFSDGYTQTGLNCTDASHNHVSPTMELDVSYAYLPENTFYVYRQFHGQAWFDDYTMNLCLKLLFTDEIKDVYSNLEYSQFEYSRTKKDEVTIYFDGSASTGYMAQDTKGVYITNRSSYPILISSIYCLGQDLKFNTLSTGRIKSGKTAYITFNGDVTDVNMARDTLVINYTQFGPASAVGIRSIPFTVVGGQNIDAEEGFVDFNLSDPADALLNKTELGKYSEIFGFKKYLSSIINTLMKYFGELFGFLKNAMA